MPGAALLFSLLTGCRPMGTEPVSPSPAAPPPAPAPLAVRWLEGPGVVLAAVGGAQLSLLRREPVAEGALNLDRFTALDAAPGVQVLAGPQPPDWAHTLAVLGRTELGPEQPWLVRWREPGEGPVELWAPLGNTRVVLEGDAPADARVQNAAAAPGGLLLGGWAGVHSDTQAMGALLLRTDSAGQLSGVWRPEVHSGEAPAFESSVDAIAPGARSWIAGHHSPPGGGGERSGLWIAQLEGDTLRGPQVLEGQDLRWSSPALALLPTSDSCWVAWVQEDAVELRRVNAELDLLSQAQLPLPPGEDPVVHLSLSATPQGMRVVVGRTQRGEGTLHVLEMQGLALSGVRSLTLPSRAVLVGQVALGDQDLLLGHAMQGETRAAFGVPLGPALGPTLGSALP